MFIIYNIRSHQILWYSWVFPIIVALVTILTVARQESLEEGLLQWVVVVPWNRRNPQELQWRKPPAPNQAWISSMGDLQDPKIEVLYHIRPYFLGIFTMTLSIIEAMYLPTWLLVSFVCDSKSSIPTFHVGQCLKSQPVRRSWLRQANGEFRLELLRRSGPRVRMSPDRAISVWRLANSWYGETRVVPKFTWKWVKTYYYQF